MLLLLLLLLLLLSSSSSSSSSSSKQPVSYTMLGPTVIVLVSEVSKAVLAWENSQNFMMPLLDSLLNQWCLRNERRNSTLMVHHHPELVSASDWLCCSRKLLQTIRSTNPDLRHISQTSFCRGTAKCWLFSQAKVVSMHCILNRLLAFLITDKTLPILLISTFREHWLLPCKLFQNFSSTGESVTTLSNTDI